MSNLMYTDIKEGDKLGYSDMSNPLRFCKVLEKSYDNYGPIVYIEWEDGYKATLSGEKYQNGWFIKKDTIVEKAIVFAQFKHKDQKDEVGKDVFEAHLKVVGEALAVLTDDNEIIAAGYLHDILEDTETTFEELVKVFGQRVADLVYEVTDEGQKDNYGKYFPRLKTKDGILIKFVDRASNLTRMESWSEDRKKQYLRRSKFWKDGSDRILRDI